MNKTIEELMGLRETIAEVNPIRLTKCLQSNSASFYIETYVAKADCQYVLIASGYFDESDEDIILQINQFGEKALFLGYWGDGTV